MKGLDILAVKIFRRNLGHFVDLLLTWNLGSKKPRGRRGVMHCSYWYFWLRE